jgi:hypothetical protein
MTIDMISKKRVGSAAERMALGGKLGVSVAVPWSLRNKVIPRGSCPVALQLVPKDSSGGSTGLLFL